MVVSSPNGVVVENGNGDDLHDNVLVSDTDSSDSINSMTSEEIEENFIERHGRRFHSHGNGAIGPYPFPVDEQEKAVSPPFYVLQGANKFLLFLHPVFVA